MTPGMLCALTCTSYRLHACTGVPRTFVWSLWACRERPVSRSAVGRAGGGNQARDTGRRRSGADPASAQHLHLVAWRGTELSAVVGHIEQQRRRLVGAQVGWSATDAAISSSTMTLAKSAVGNACRSANSWSICMLLSLVERQWALLWPVGRSDRPSEMHGLATTHFITANFLS